MMYFVFFAAGLALGIWFTLGLVDRDKRKVVGDGS